MAEGTLHPLANAAIYPSLAGKRVIVSGGASGIGEGIVEAFVRQGAAVAFVDVMAEESDALVRRFADAAIAPVFIHCDIRDSVDYGAKIGKIIDRLGGCDVLINNAANDDRHSIEDITPEYWDERMAVNLKHQFFAAKAVVPAMKAAGGGSIVNLGSISWHLGLADLTVYQVAKATISASPSGVYHLICRGVWTLPGTMVLTRIRSRPSSRARLRVSPSIAALATW